MNILTISNWSNDNVKIGICCLVTFYIKMFKSSNKFTIQVASSSTTFHMPRASLLTMAHISYEEKGISITKSH